jgi:hypothetical protein
MNSFGRNGKRPPYTFHITFQTEGNTRLETTRRTMGRGRLFYQDLWVVMPCSVAVGYKRFRGPCRLHSHPTSTIHSFKNQKTLTWIFTTVKVLSHQNILGFLGASLDDLNLQFSLWGFWWVFIIFRIFLTQRYHEICPARKNIQRILLALFIIVTYEGRIFWNIKITK